MIERTVSESTESPACVLCGTREQRTVLQQVTDTRYRTSGSWSIVRCTCCALAYLSPRPDKASIDAHYPPNTAEHQLGHTRFAAAESQLVGRLHPTVGNLLDVGCASGGFLTSMADRGWTVFGVEQSPQAARLAARCAEVHTGTIESAPFEPESFEVVTFWSVIEHTHDPLAALRRARALLKPNGLLVLGLPNFGGLERRIFGRHWFGLDVPRHLYHFEPKTISAALHRAGLNVREIRHSSGHDSLTRSLRTAVGLGGEPDTAHHHTNGGASTSASDARHLVKILRAHLVQQAVRLADKGGAGSQMIVVASR